jgi:hypothetical protein
MTTKDHKVPVSIRAFEGRMRRHMLSKESQVMRKCRDDMRFFADMGTYYFVQMHTGVVESRGLSLDDLINWAREDGVLKPYEVIDDHVEKPQSDNTKAVHDSRAAINEIDVVRRKITALVKSRSEVANSMLALARKEITATDGKAIVKKANAVTRAVAKSTSKQ